MWNFLIVNPMTNLLLWIYDLIGHNFGLAIILFTVLIRLVTWPLNAQQIKGARAMQQFQNDKEWLDLQKKYAKDRERLAQEQLRLYRERGINPLASCLPLLIQMPILFGLFGAINRVLAITPQGLLDLSRAIYPVLQEKALIPLNSHFLWMNLGRPEGIPLPFDIGFLPHGLPVLAILVALSTYFQTKMSTPAANAANANDQTVAMTNSMSITMPLMLGYFALVAASGVALYLLTTNLLGILQYAIGGASTRTAAPSSPPAEPARKK